MWSWVKNKVIDVTKSELDIDAIVTDYVAKASKYAIAIMLMIPLIAQHVILSFASFVVGILLMVSIKTHKPNVKSPPIN
jgi:hypothetical protein